MTSNLFSAPTVGAAQPALGNGLLANIASLGDAIGPGIFSALLNAVGAGGASSGNALASTDLLVSAGAALPGPQLAAEQAAGHALSVVQLHSIAFQATGGSESPLLNLAGNESAAVQEIHSNAIDENFRLASSVFEAAGLTTSVTEAIAAPEPASIQHLLDAVHGPVEFDGSVDTAPDFGLGPSTPDSITNTLIAPGKPSRGPAADLLFRSEEGEVSSSDPLIPTGVPDFVTPWSAVQPPSLPQYEAAVQSVAPAIQPVSSGLSPRNRSEQPGAKNIEAVAPAGEQLVKPVSASPLPPQTTPSQADPLPQPEAAQLVTNATALNPEGESTLSESASGVSPTNDPLVPAASRIRDVVRPNVPEATAIVPTTVDTPTAARPILDSPQIEIAQPEIDFNAATVQDGQPAVQLSQRATAPSPLTQQVLTSVVQQITTAELSDPQTITMRLDPPDLGEMTVRFQQTSDGIHLQLDAREPVTLDMLLMRSDEIQRLLQNQELDISRVEFRSMESSVGGESSSETDARQDHDHGPDDHNPLHQLQRQRNTRPGIDARTQAAQRIRA